MVNVAPTLTFSSSERDLECSLWHAENCSVRDRYVMGRLLGSSNIELMSLSFFFFKFLRLKFNQKTRTSSRDFFPLGCFGICIRTGGARQ